MAPAPGQVTDQQPARRARHARCAQGWPGRGGV